MTWGWSFEFKLADFWIGVFWKWERGLGGPDGIDALHVWICLIPCFPLHLIGARNRFDTQEADHAG